MAPKKKLLVVDDDEGIREAFASLLSDEGFDIRTAENGARALRLCEEGYRPDAILLDLQMPVVNGYEFRQRQAETHGLREVPVIVLSASRFLSARSEGLQGTVVLPKPVDADHLIQAVQRAIG